MKLKKWLKLKLIIKKKIKEKDGNKTKKIKREEGPTRNKKWGILKYPYVEILFEKSDIF